MACGKRYFPKGLPRPYPQRPFYGDENIQGDGKREFSKLPYHDIKDMVVLENVVSLTQLIFNLQKRRAELVKEKMRPYFDIIILNGFPHPFECISLARKRKRERQVPSPLKCLKECQKL